MKNKNTGFHDLNRAQEEAEKAKAKAEKAKAKAEEAAKALKQSKKAQKKAEAKAKANEDQCQTLEHSVFELSAMLIESMRDDDGFIRLEMKSEWREEFKK